MSAKARDQQRPHVEDSSSTTHTSAFHGESAPQGGGAQIALSWGVGLAAIGAGFALAAAPQLPWQAQQLLADSGNQLAQAATLIVGGLGLIGIGLVRRAQARVPHNDNSLVLDQVATDLMMMREQVEEVGAHCQRLTSSVESLSGELGRLGEQQRMQPPSGGHEDALFGLASSLDKLGAKLEQRQVAHQQTLLDGFEDLHTGLVRSHQSLAEQFVHTVNSLALAQPPAPLPAEVEQQHVDTSDTGSALGLLDSLDEHGSVLARDLDRSPAFEHLSHLDDLQREIDTAAHSHTLEEELQLVEPSAARAKLDQLGALLADPELRGLLDNLRQRA